MSKPKKTKGLAASVPKSPQFNGALTVTMTQAAKLLGVSRWTLYDWMHRGKLPLEIRHVNGRPRVLTRSIEKALAL